MYKRRIAWLFGCGLGVGWLVGQSLSPVVQGVLTALVGVVTSAACLSRGKDADDAADGATTAPGGDKPKPQLRISPALAGSLAIGIAAGAALGVAARTHEWLAPRPDPKPTPQETIAQWKEVGLKEEEVAKKLFEKEMAAEAKAGQSRPPHTTPGLYYRLPPEDKKVLPGLKGQKLVQQMLASKDPHVRTLAEKCQKHPECLEAVVEEILCPEE
jgi:hypothetical protein